MTDSLAAIFESVIAGNVDKTEEHVQSALASGVPAEKLLHAGLIRAMDEVGARFEQGEMFVPEMLIAARAMKGGLAILKPQLTEAGIDYLGRVVIGTVKGDLHDIGKNLVGMMLEGSGFEVIDLGIDVPPDRFAGAAREHRANVVGMSALLTTTMLQMKDTVEAIEDIGLRDQVVILIGGAPVTQTYAEEIGADGYAPDASRAVALAKSLLGAKAPSI